MNEESNVKLFPPLKTEKLMEEAIVELATWADNLIAEDVEVTTIIGMMEVCKHQVISEMFDFYEEEEE
tara:strand:- start:4426 stop:4629 length:204 start_codon:yes stop_codon:yes gene_type:complete